MKRIYNYPSVTKRFYGDYEPAYPKEDICRNRLVKKICCNPETVTSFNAKKSCTVCHNLPKSGNFG